MQRVDNIFVYYSSFLQTHKNPCRWESNPQTSELRWNALIHWSTCTTTRMAAELYKSNDEYRLVRTGTVWHTAGLVIKHFPQVDRFFVATIVQREAKSRDEQREPGKSQSLVAIEIWLAILIGICACYWLGWWHTSSYTPTKIYVGIECCEAA